MHGRIPRSVTYGTITTITNSVEGLRRIQKSTKTELYHYY